MPKHDAQHTDAENTRALHTASPTDSEPTLVYQKSALEIAGKQKFSEQTETGSGADPVTAPITKQVTNNA
jgi:hypothetical protein